MFFTLVITGFTQTFATTTRQMSEKSDVHLDRIMTESACEWVVIRADDPLERVWLLRVCVQFGLRHWFGIDVCVVLDARGKFFTDFDCMQKKGPMKQPRGLAIISPRPWLGRWYYGSIYHGISPVSSATTCCDTCT
jgi:hypothetical protein